MAVYFYSKNPGSFVSGKRFGIDEPAPTIMAQGMAGDSICHWRLTNDGVPESMPKNHEQNKPPYRVPLMREIVALPWNGLKVASTFSGAGGSCTGYRMAGYRVVWANEFVPAAQETYKANAAPDSILDLRDVRQVKPEDILSATGLAVGELDLFDGSPPCQAFSTAGKRDKNWGKGKTYEHGATQCNETLFGEYLRLLGGLRPKVFVAENVSGLVKGTAKGYFIEIMRSMKLLGYNVACRILDAQWLGVPQARQRTIFVGVRNDLGRAPAYPTPLPYRHTVRDAIPWIEKAIHDTGGTNPNRWAANVDITDRPSPAITNGVNGINSYHFQVVNSGLPDAGEHDVGIGKYAIGNAYDNTQVGSSSGQFFNLKKPHPDGVCQTITACGGSVSAASVVHPFEKRKFTIAELKRLCAFPDDFVLCGTYAQQWERLGNSVPPVMMYHIASAIRDRVFNAA